MLQEVILSSEQLNVQVSKYGYTAVTNVDMTNPTAFGTGLVWQSHLGKASKTNKKNLIGIFQLEGGWSARGHFPIGKNK